MSKIRIAYVMDQMGIGGTERQLKYLLDGLDRQMFEPFLFLLRGSVDHPFMPENVPAEVLNVGSLLSYNGFRKLFFFKKTLQSRRIQIVQTFFQDATSFAVLAAKLADVPRIVVSIRDMLFWATVRNSWAHRIATSMANVILVNSKAVEARVGHYVKKVPIEVIYNGIPVENINFNNKSAKKKLVDELGISSDVPIVTLVSNCNRPVKRVDVFVDSIPFIVNEANAFFLVIGNGHLRNSLEKRAERLGISKYIRFLGQRCDVERILAGSNIAVNTSDSEGFSNTLLEAMRAGLPVVTSNVAGNKELVDHNKNGLHFRSGNHKDLSEKLSYLIENEAISRSMGKIGQKKIISEFSLEKMVKKHQKFYESLIRLTFC